MRTVGWWRLRKVLTGFLLALLLAQVSHSQKLEKQVIFTPKEMNGMWETFGSDKGWQAILKETQAKGFARIKGEESAWGFRGTIVNESGEKEDALFCIYDLEGKAGNCSMVWCRRGSGFYKAYIVIPRGKGLADGDEWFVNEQNQIEKAHSWRRCMLKNLPKCGSFCGAAVVPCAIAAGTTVSATAGVGAITSPAIFLGCLAGACGGCAALYSIICAAK